MNYKDHIGFANAAYELLSHHVSLLQKIATDSDDQKMIDSLATPLGQLETVLSLLYYKHYEDR